MADFAPTGQPRSIAAQLAAPSNPAVFVLPQGVAFDLQSVIADIDATGAGKTTALLTIADSSGAVIAKKRQSETIDAGATGTATWALRLADDSGSGSALFLAAGRYSGNAVSINNGLIGNLTWNTFINGTGMLSLAVPATPTVLSTGMYTVSVTVVPNAAMTVGGRYQVRLTLQSSSGTSSADHMSSPAAAAAGTTAPPVTVTLARDMTAGDALQVSVTNLDGVARAYRISTATVALVR